MNHESMREGNWTVKEKTGLNVHVQTRTVGETEGTN